MKQYAGAGAILRAAIPEVVAKYRSALLQVSSPLATHSVAWEQCRHQATNILNECAHALTSHYRKTEVPDDYTRLLGSHRALQEIPASESVRAVELLWLALEPAVQQAAAQEPLAHRSEVWRRVNSAFRTAAGGRLHTGMLGYEEARARVLAGSGASSEQVSRSYASSMAMLTGREQEVLEAVARAMTNGQIARSLGITESTVKRHLSNAFFKLEVSSRMQAVYKVFGGYFGR